MADIRINALATTAASTASDDFVAVDGSANGTRKLNAYSPTFGGNLTVNSTTDASSAPTGSIYTAGGIAVGTNKKFMATGTGGYWGAAAASTLDTLLIRATGFGYSPTSYAGVQIGGTAGRSIIFGVDVSAIAGGQFSGASNEWIIPNTLNIRQVTSDGTNFSTAIFTIGNGGATTIGGNLTVSGTGTQTFSGQIYTSKVGASGGSPAGMGFFAGTTVSGSTDGIGIGANGAGAYKIIQSYGGALSVNPSGNNLLLGTTTDSSNGRVQLATHTTSAGGIGFGTDTSLYREAAGTLSINHSGGDSRLYFYNAGTAQGRVESASSNFFVTAMAGSLILRSGGTTTALTLDSSQNATFAGNLTVSGTGTQSFNGTIALKAAAVGDGITLRESYAGNSLLFSVLQNSGDGTGATIAGADGAGSTTFSVNTQTGAATFSGSIAIGNTVNTVSPTSPNRTITMVIGGTTYYIHAKTTND